MIRRYSARTSILCAVGVLGLVFVNAGKAQQGVASKAAPAARPAAGPTSSFTLAQASPAAEPKVRARSGDSPPASFKLAQASNQPAGDATKRRTKETTTEKGAAAKDEKSTKKSTEPPMKKEEKPAKESTTTKVKMTEETTEESGYREVSDFFNIREANASVTQGEWEIEVTGAWFTNSDGTDDDFSLSPSLKYGITDDLFVELEVLPLNLGDGGDQGNGDLALIIFNRFLRETDSLPAIAGWAEMRIPSGEGSSGVDGSFHVNVTKTIVPPKLRAHLEGFVETANGARGAGDEDRRHFQWGLGPGFDYQCDEKTLGLINYLMRSSENEEHHNQNILEIGMVRELASNQHLKAALDIGLDGAEETPNLGLKIQWSIDLK